MSKLFASYCRVSTSEQVKDGYSLSAQLARCQSYVASEGGTLVKSYADEGLSGSLPPAKRPALNQLLTDLKSKAIVVDTVLTWKVDRLSRSLRDTLNIEHALRSMGICLKSVTENFDDSAAGKMMLNNLSNFSEYEALQISERTRMVMSSKVSEIFLGGKPAIGYRRVGNKLEIDQKNAELVRFIFKKFLCIRTCLGTARYLNSKGLLTANGNNWNSKQLKFCLSNFIYVGATVWNRKKRKMVKPNKISEWVIKQNTHEPIISRQTFRRVQNILKTGYSEVCIPNGKA